MTIYIDMLIIDNMLLNIVILLSVSEYMKQEKKIVLLFVSSVIGTCYSVFMAVFMVEWLNSWILKLFLSIIMVYVAFIPKRIKEFFKLILCFYIVTFIFAGLAIALVFLWGQTLTNQNGMMYFYWSSPIKYLLIVAFFGFWLIKKFVKIIQKKRLVMSRVVDLSISLCGTVCVLPALVDTGNELKDPVTEQPVVIVEFSQIKKCFPIEFVTAIENGEKESWNNVGEFLTGTDLAESVDMDRNLLYEMAGRFRLVPFKSLGCEHGLMPAIRADYICVQDIGVPEYEEPEQHKNVIVCFSLQSLSSDQTYFALVGTDFSIKNN